MRVSVFPSLSKVGLKKRLKSEGRPVSWRHDGRRSGRHGNLAGRQSIENTATKRDKEPGRSSDTSSRIHSTDLRHTSVAGFTLPPFSSQRDARCVTAKNNKRKETRCSEWRKTGD